MHENSPSLALYERAAGASRRRSGQRKKYSALRKLIVAMGVLFLWIPYLLLKKSPQRWWLYTSVASVPLLALVMLVQSVLIAPLFDDFGPMRDKALEAKILRLAERAGIDGGRVFGCEMAHPRLGPLYLLWRSRHPPIAERIEFANTYRPWETVLPLTYADYFRAP